MEWYGWVAVVFAVLLGFGNANRLSKVDRENRIIADIVRRRISGADDDLKELNDYIDGQK